MTVPAPAGSAIVRALEENLQALWSRFGRGDGCALHDDGGALWFDTPLPTLPYNAVLRFAVDDEPERRVDALFEHYRRRSVPFLWIVHPSARPAHLAELLRRRGFEEAEVCPGMALDLDRLPEREPPPDGVEIAEAVAPRDVRDALDLIAWRWEVPSRLAPDLAATTRAFELGTPGSAVRAWLARRDGAPVAKVVLHLAAGAAGIYGVVTRPEARGLGLARRMTIAALHAAREAGHRLAVLHSTPMARSLYERLGFREHATFRVFAPPRALHL